MAGPIAGQFPVRKEERAVAYQDILFEVEDGIATITLNRPEQLNAFTPIMLEEVAQAVEEARDDDAIRVLVLTGAGRAFCSGGHVKTMGQAVGEAAKTVGRQRLRGIHQMQSGLHNLNKPTIAAVNGPAVGGGLDLAMNCDLRIASDRATFSEIYVKLGLAPGAGGTYSLPRLVGLPKALELAMTGDFLDAQEALRLGLVNKVVPHEELVAATKELATKLAANAPLSVQHIKRAVYRSLNMSLEETLEYMAFVVERLRQTEDHKEALSARAEKRPPVFHGR